MTSEEAKVKTFDILHFVADNAGLSIFETIEKAYNTGVSDKAVDRAIEIQNILTQLHREYQDTENGAAGEDVRWWNAGIRRAIEIVERSDKE